MANSKPGFSSARTKRSGRQLRPKAPPKTKRKKTPPPPDSPASGMKNTGIFIVWGILMAGAVGLVVNLYRLQIVEAPNLEKQARQQQSVNLRPYIPRRPILDRLGNVLATDRLVYTLYAHPKNFKPAQEPEIVNQLANILEEETPQSLQKRFQGQDTGILVAYGLTENIADKIKSLSFDGLELIRHYSRYYPQKEQVADVIGYVDRDHQGQAGIEYSQNDLLERDVLTLGLNRAGNGALVPTHIPEGFLNFDNQQLQLTLDLRLQRIARSRLKEQLQLFDAKRGGVIVMDVRTGEILTLVSEPTFDPNRYYKYDIVLFKNWTVTDLYEPGSTFKPLTIALALEQGAIEPESLFEDTGKMWIDTWEIKNHDYKDVRGRGEISVAEILQYSSNIGMVQISRRMNRTDYYDGLLKLGLKEKVNIDLSGEAVGQLKEKGQFVNSSVESATASFGQGFSLTPIKLVQLHSAIANGGQLVQPHLIRGMVEDNQLYRQSTSDFPSVFTSQTSRQVLEMMEQVVEKGHVGKFVGIPGYRVAGKTGTAQKASPLGGYYDDIKVTSFIGIFPVDEPRYAILAVVDEPKGEYTYGSNVAAPIVKSVIEALIAIDKIPPSQDKVESAIETIPPSQDDVERE